MYVLEFEISVAVTEGARHPVTLFTPGKLDRLTLHDWDDLAKMGFPAHLYDRAFIGRRRPTWLERNSI